ncbi:hypothetical protein [Croceibacterium aestuarii]|uniref:hypothetical protein n=1 Tax=Croceibacterium aestuarii TaxID=3064139 RepID=UPI00272E295C|nr:hypothetical protein [Croceibacterium sp. D39]
MTGISLGTAIVSRAPNVVAALMPFFASSHDRFADALVQGGMIGKQNQLIRSEAAAALRRSPLMVHAARSLALVTTEPRQQAEIMAYADSLSRRDLLTNTWFIEQAHKAGQIEEELARIDLALRSSASGQTVLFPLLASLLTKPANERAIARLFERQPNWLPAFVDFAVSRRLATEPLTAALRGIAIASPPGKDLPQSLVDLLIAEHHYHLALDYATERDPALASTTGFLRDPSFARAEGITPFSWLYVSNGLFGARPADNGVELYGSSTAGGVALGQLVLLRPGRYELETRGRVGGGTAKWVVDCAPPANRTLTELEIPRDNERVVQTAFTVGAGCPAQFVRLTVRASETSAAFEGKIVEIRVSQASE